MSIQSTTFLKRKEAEECLVRKLEQENRKFIEAQVHIMSDKEIENKLESDFDNYKILD